MSTGLIAPSDISPLPPFGGELLRRPPHDPTWIPLDARGGWRATTLDGTEQQAGIGALALQPAPGSGRSVAEETGSFGGVRLPSNLAQAADSTLYLLDRADLAMKRFDVCHCRFVPVPCYGGQGSDARHLNGSTAIAICGGNLLVCDPGNHRLVVIALKGFVVRAVWTAPITTALPAPWEPVDVACDGRGRAYVADRANRAVHVFAATGIWQRWSALPAAPRFVAVDCHDVLYVVLAGESAARVLATDGWPRPNVTRPQDLAPSFPSAPLPSTSTGAVDVSALCCQPEGSVWVDEHGVPLPTPPPAEPPQYQKSGTYISEALDSRLFRCQWHRIVLDGIVPRGSSVVVSTYTSEAEVPAEVIAALDDEAWETRQMLRGTARAWDALVRSGGGRYLWLRLSFTGNGSVTPSIAAARVEFPRISMRRYLPAVFGDDPSLTDFTDRFLSLFDTTFRSIEREVDEQAQYFDAQSAPAEAERPGGIDFLSYLASWLGVTLDRAIPEARRRELLRNAGRTFPIRGTREALHRSLLIFLGLEPRQICGERGPRPCTCSPPPPNCRPEPPCSYTWQDPPLLLEHYQIRRWLFVGAGRLGDESRLWGERITHRAHLDRGAEIGVSRLDTTPDPLHDPFLVYAHRYTAFVPARVGRDPGQRRALTNLLSAESPAHTQYTIEYVEPRFRIGVQATVGFNSVVGRYPSGVRLGETPIGPASVLSSPAWSAGGPSLQLGTASRIGSTTRLE